MLIDGEDRSARGGASPARPSLHSFANARVVLIDDEPANLSLLSQLLTRSGLSNLHPISDSREAVAQITALDPDLVLLDLHMPGVDGYAVLAELRDRAAGSYLPVLVLTADTTRRAITRALELGAKDFLTKPFDIDEVTLRVRNLLETKQLHTTLRQHNVRLHQRLGEFEAAAELENDARAAIRERIQSVLGEGSLRMVFQPILDLDASRLVGYEALARFDLEPAQGPDRWFAEADAIGLGTELEVQAIGAALRRLPDLTADAFLALNVSPSTAMSAQLCDLLADADCSRLVLELTEHVPVEDYEAVNAGLRPLRERGARLALDDTGAGYAGFRHLLGLQPDLIKLDISLTRDIDQDPVRRALAGALVAFAAEVDATVIAEGVENGNELATLERLNIGWVQGYHLGRPGELPAPSRPGAR